VQKVQLKWTKGFQFIVRDDLGHEIIIDTKKEVGGTETGFQPIDLILVSLAGCMAFDIVSILQKKKVDLKSFVAEVEGERCSEHPKRYTKITVKFKANREVNKEDITRAYEISKDKYCSVLATLKNPPAIEFKIE